MTPKPSAGGLKPGEPRTSQDQQSQSGSDESYDLVSRAASSKDPGSPREEKDKEKEKQKDGTEGAAPKREDSDEEDWE